MINEDIELLTGWAAPVMYYCSFFCAEFEGHVSLSSSYGGSKQACDVIILRSWSSALHIF